MHTTRQKKRKELQRCNAIEFILGVSTLEDIEAPLIERTDISGYWPRKTHPLTTYHANHASKNVDKELKQNLDAINSEIIAPEALSSNFGIIIKGTEASVEEFIVHKMKVTDYLARSDSSHFTAMTSESYYRDLSASGVMIPAS